MTALALTRGVYMVPTPAGALHAVTGGDDGPAKRLLRNLLRSEEPVRTDDFDVLLRTGLPSEEEGLELVASSQERGWVEGRDEPLVAPEGPLGQALPGLLAPLSDIGEAALIDDQGFPLASVGLTDDTETELSTLAAEIARLGQRRRAAATAVLGAGGWAIVDRFGVSTTAFFPLVVGAQPFVLTISGNPRLNHPTFATLVAALSVRYGATLASDIPQSTEAQTTGGRTNA